MLEVVKNASGRIMFKSLIEVYDAHAEEMGLKDKDETLVPICFDPLEVTSYRPSYTKGRTEKLLQTLVEIKGTDGYVIECTFDKFHEVFMNYK